MIVEKNRVVSIEYTLTDPQGQVLDSSQGRPPLAYLHGEGNIIPGLESALEGKNPGDQLTVDVAPDQAYGQREDNLVQPVPRKMFKDAPKLRVGMQFQAQTELGPRLVTIVGFDDDEVVVDGNHPLAGVPLRFDVKIVEVRDATPEELEHGHAHGPEGHHHHH